MKVIYNNVIPFKGFKAINLFGVLFVRKGATISDEDINHEAIHSAQMRELLWLPFYIAYLGEWIYRLFAHTDSAYKGISFEREAYAKEDDLNYLEEREHYAQWRHTYE